MPDAAVGFDQVFSLGSMAALVGWALLVLLPRWRGVAQAAAGLLVPALLALAYTVLVGIWWSRGQGGFGSVAEVRALFASTPVLVAGWFHYLAFDLFVGAWIARQAREEGIAHLLVVPVLILTFLFGPIGFLAFLGLRFAVRAGRLNMAASGGILRGILAPWALLAARQPVLAATGAVFLLAMVPTGLALILDGRTLGGVDVWLKPLKFELSLSLFALSLAWFMPLASEAFRRSLAGRAVVWGFALPAAFEIGYILWRASRGEASHFNVATPGAALGYALMGVGAVTLTATAPLLAWGIARADALPAAPAYRLAVILGLALTFVLGGIEGMVMSAQSGHAVGVATAGDTGLPLFGWLRTAGDLRVAHFLGIHVQQALPLFGALAAAVRPARGRAEVWIFAGVYALICLAAFAQALAGLPLLPA